MGDPGELSLAQRASSGFRWASTSQAGRSGIQFVSNAILARLLSPKDFGLLGMALIVTGFASLLRDLGTSAAIIQRRDLSRGLVSSVFWINAGLGLTAAVLVFAASPLVAAFFKQPPLTGILRALSASFVMAGLGVVHQAMLQRSLQFRGLAVVDLVSAFVSAVAGIGFAMAGAGVWSLVYQALVLALVSTVLLWVVSPVRPAFEFHWGEVKQVSSYSLNLTSFNVFNYFIRNADNLLIGKFLGAGPLGYYSLAYRLLLFPLQIITDVTSRVLFPVCSELQDDHERFRRAYLKAVSGIATLSFPLMLGMAALARPLITTVFGAQWGPSEIPLMILAPAGMLQSVTATVGPIYQAKGRADWLFRWGAGAGVAVLIAFAVGLRWGVIGVAAAYAAVTTLLTIPGLAIPFSLVQLRLAAFFESLWRPMASALAMCALLVGASRLLGGRLMDWQELLLLVPAGALIYTGLSLLINRHQMRELLAAMGKQR